MNLFTCAKRSLVIEHSEYFIRTYRRFMSEYNKGGDPEYIKNIILSDIHTRTCDNEYFLHDVYLALARAMWEIGRLPDDLLRITGDIIRSGADLEYYRIKSFPPESIARREANLNDFLCRIMLPNRAPRGRIPPDDADQAIYRVGDVFSYDDDGRRRLLVIADSVDQLPLLPLYFCCVPERYYDGALPTPSSLLNERLGLMGVFNRNTMISPESLAYVMHLDIPAGKYLELFDRDFMLKPAGSFYGELHINWPCTLKGFIECRPGCTEQFYPMNVRHGGTDPESIPEW